MTTHLILYVGDDLRAEERAAGGAEYSYTFVVAAFEPVLSQIGTLHRVRHLDEVEPVRALAEAAGEACVVLSFVPPHKTTLFLRVPMVPVFAWEFENIPYEVWDNQPKHDWRLALSQLGRAITLSTHSADVVRRTMGALFPVIGVPPPVHDRMSQLRTRICGRLPQPQQLSFAAWLIDTRALDLNPAMRIPPLPDTGEAVQDLLDGERPMPVERLMPERVVEPLAVSVAPKIPRIKAPSPALDRFPTWRALGRSVAGHAKTTYVERIRDRLPDAARAVERRMTQAAARRRGALPQAVSTVLSMPPIATPIDPNAGPIKANPPHVSLSLEGIVYLAVLNPSDGRKNWPELVTGFTWGLRDREDATLVIKLTAPTTEEYWGPVFREIRKQPAFRCRVVFIHGHLDDTQMDKLLAAASYVVNSSSCEGCALPLLEGMSVGRPAIAPDHTAMEDYIRPDNAFIVRSHLELTAWPHDGRRKVRTMWHCPRWDTVRDAFVASYALVKNDPDRWLAMGRAAVEAQRAFCSDAPVERALRDFLGLQETAAPLNMGTRDLGFVPVLEAEAMS